MSNKCGSLDEQMELFLAAVRAKDADGIASAIDRLGQQFGPAAGLPMANALEANKLTDTMVALLQERAKKLRTAMAWNQAANAAVIAGRDEIATQAAGTALQLDPAMATAAFLLSVAANRRGEHDIALRAIADLAGRMPAAKEDPHLLLQVATAELGRKQPQAALAVLDPALARLTAAGLGFDAHVLRARALSAVPERSSQAADAWERALAVAQGPLQTDHARDGLIAALSQDKRFDD